MQATERIATEKARLVDDLKAAEKIFGPYKKPEKLAMLKLELFDSLWEIFAGAAILAGDEARASFVVGRMVQAMTPYRVVSNAQRKVAEITLKLAEIARLEDQVARMHPDQIHGELGGLDRPAVTP